MQKQMAAEQVAAAIGAETGREVSTEQLREWEESGLPADLIEVTERVLGIEQGKLRDSTRNPRAVAFGNRLRAIRKSRKMFITDFKIDGLQAKSYNAYETGQNVPTVLQLLDIADALKVRPSYILGETSEAEQSDDDFIREYLALPDDQKRRVQRYLFNVVMPESGAD